MRNTLITKSDLGDSIFLERIMEKENFQEYSEILTVHLKSLFNISQFKKKIVKKTFSEKGNYEIIELVILDYIKDGILVYVYNDIEFFSPEELGVQVTIFKQEKALGEDSFIEKLVIDTKKKLNEETSLKAKEGEMLLAVPKKGGGIEFSALKIKPLKIDIHKHYNDEFFDVHKRIVESFNKENGNGLVLLHGNPGTGKTTYLKHLTTVLENKVIYITPEMAECITSPELLSTLMKHKGSILVIEEAEKILVSRKFNQNGAGGVSSLLNISDGILGDILNVKVVCTFNTDLTSIDEALLRDGRLICEYKFDKLKIEKAKELFEEVNQGEEFPNKEMTVSEIFNFKNKAVKTEVKTGFGFRK